MVPRGNSGYDLRELQAQRRLKSLNTSQSSLEAIVCGPLIGLVSVYIRSIKERGSNQSVEIIHGTQDIVYRRKDARVTMTLSRASL